MGVLSLKSESLSHGWVEHFPKFESVPLSMCVLAIPRMNLNREKDRVNSSDVYMNNDTMHLSQHIHVVTSTELLNRQIGRGSQNGLCRVLDSKLSDVSLNFTKELVKRFMGEASDEPILIKSVHAEQGRRSPWMVKVLGSMTFGNDLQFLVTIEEVSTPALSEKLMATNDHLVSDLGRWVTIGMVSTKVLCEIESSLRIIFDSAMQMSAPGYRMTHSSLYTNDEVRDALSKSERLLRSVRSLTENAQDANSSEVHLRTVVSNVKTLIEGTAYQDHVDIRFPEIPHDVWVKVDPLQLAQVFVNLISNSCDAVLAFEERWIELHLAVDTSTVTALVVDSGLGIPDDVAARMFDGFFTTKTAGKGTGLGLHLSQNILRSFGGDLYLDALAPHTTFVMTIPRVDLNGHSTTSNEVDWEEI